ncbi:MAG: hypothetical protein ABIT38_06105, partial [Gemmatimonadaceae bacterium]
MMTSAVWRWGIVMVGVVSLFLGGPPRAHAQSAAATPQTAQPSRAPTTRLVVVSGVSGEKRFADMFATWTASVSSAAKSRFGIPDSLVTTLSEDTTATAGRTKTRSTRENVLAAV